MYPKHSNPRTGNYLSGVRLAYHRSRKGMWLYANDFAGDPAPLLIALAAELEQKGVSIVYIQRQGSYDPPDPKATAAAINDFNDRFPDNW